MGCSYFASYFAAPGERNDVRLSDGGDGLHFTDPGAVVHSVSSYCRVDGYHAVTCELPESPVEVDVHAGDGADRVDGSGITRSDLGLDGGSGPDVLIGGDDQDKLIGGSGDDVLVGGAGQDVASYRDHAVPVHASLRRGVARSGGEVDRLQGIEDLTGGSASDILTGDSHANSLYGGGGDDRLRGGAGRDDLGGGPGADVLDGGGGDDQLGSRGSSDFAGNDDEGSGPDEDVCGRGFDVVEIAGRRLRVDDSCERVDDLNATLEPVRLDLEHQHPSSDSILIPLDYPGAPFTLAARFETADGSMTIGSLERRVTVDYDRHHVRLRLSPAGARYLERHAPLDARLVLRATQQRGFTYRDTVALRLHRH